MKGYTDIEKAGFMELQALIGISKFDREDKDGNSITYSTTSHGVTRSVFKKLQELGYIENYKEEYKKDSRLILPKIAFGNFKGLKSKVQMYDMEFNLTDKKLDIADPELQKKLPIIFGRKGLIQKRGIEIVSDTKGGLTLKYGEKSNIPERNEKDTFVQEIKANVPSYEDQARNANEIVNNKQQNIDRNNKEEKEL